MRMKTDRKPGTTPGRPPRVLVPDASSGRSGDEIPFGQEELRHLRVRRLRDGDEVVVLDGKGGRGSGTIVSKGAAVRLTFFEETAGDLPPSPRPSFASLPGEPALRLTVLLAAAEPARVEWAVEKGTECGAAAFVLLACERSQRAHVAALHARLARLARIAAEATKQCDRTIVPAVEGPEAAADVLRRWTGRLLLAAPDAPPLGPGFAGKGGEGPRAVAIGPEGGFSPPERALFEECGALSFSLGPRILRLETAVVAAVTLLVGGR